jgi:hypothetical protein
MSNINMATKFAEQAYQRGCPIWVRIPPAGEWQEYTGSHPNFNNDSWEWTHINPFESDTALTDWREKYKQLEKHCDVLTAEHKRMQEENDTRSNIMGRIAIALFGEKNNVSDEACAKRLEVWRDWHFIHQGEPEAAGGDPPKLEAVQSADQQQVGGSHYKDFAIQPAEFCQRNNIGFLEGCVIKRMCRHEFKGELEDLEKAIHEIILIAKYTYNATL